MLATAESLARKLGAKLVLFRAVGIPQDMPLAAFAHTDKSLEDILMSNARADLERLAGDLDPALVEATVTVFATPWDGICREARERDVDLIAIGSHGYSRLDRLLGTTAGKVANHSDRSVLIVRGEPGL